LLLVLVLFGLFYYWCFVSRLNFASCFSQLQDFCLIFKKLFPSLC
jgi:hypothetical protein